MTLWGHLSWYLKDQPKIRPYLHPEEFVGNWDGRLDMFRQYTSRKLKIGEMRCWRTQLVDNDLTCANHGSANLGLHKVHPPGPLFFGCGCEPGTGAESLTDCNRILSLLSLAFPHSLILLLSLTTTPSIDRLCPWVDVPLSRSVPILAAVSVAALCAAPRLWPVSDQGTLFTTRCGSVIVVP